MAVSHACAALRTRKSRPGRRGFTLIELLIVILVLAILMAVALPLYLGAVNDSQVKTCRANMQTIANAEQAYKTSQSAHTYTTTIANLNTNLGATPTCPSGGTYSVVISDGTELAQNTTAVPAGGLIISCNGNSGGTAHGVFAPGIDSQ